MSGEPGVAVEASGIVLTALHQNGRSFRVVEELRRYLSNTRYVVTVKKARALARHLG